MTSTELWVCRLETIAYRAALDLQERLRTARQADLVPDVLLTLQHPPVYTRGRRSDAGELPMSEDWYRAQGIEILGTDRGGRVTYHGPGQLVGYPIMRIEDVIGYLRTMEHALVAALADAGITARARPDDGPDFTGVWTGERKIASIGVHVARSVTTHGFAINVDNDLRPFGWIVPCGLAGVQMTSVLEETRDGGGAPVTLEDVRASVELRFAEVFARRARPIDAAQLDAALAAATAPAMP
jgi:lipoyl(octanoyl) transferase